MTVLLSSSESGMLIRPSAPSQEVRPRGCKTFSMLNSTEYEIFPAHKYQNANNCWHFNI